MRLYRSKYRTALSVRRISMGMLYARTRVYYICLDCYDVCSFVQEFSVLERAGERGLTLPSLSYITAVISSQQWYIHIVLYSEQ